MQDQLEQVIRTTVCDLAEIQAEVYAYKKTAANPEAAQQLHDLEYRLQDVINDLMHIPPTENAIQAGINLN